MRIAVCRPSLCAWLKTHREPELPLIHVQEQRHAAAIAPRLLTAVVGVGALLISHAIDQRVIGAQEIAAGMLLREGARGHKRAQDVARGRRGVSGVGGGGSAAQRTARALDSTSLWTSKHQQPRVRYARGSAAFQTTQSAHLAAPHAWVARAVGDAEPGEGAGHEHAHLYRGRAMGAAARCGH